MEKEGVEAMLKQDYSEDFVPQTPLGKELLRIRNDAIQKGMRLMSEAEILYRTKEKGTKQC